MSPRAGLPGRILIPLANPRTAADLVAIGAGVMDRAGSVTALSIVEVPEGMPLSEGATKARQSRRLLQRVLEFAPEGVEVRTMVRIGRRAAEGICETAAEEDADLIIFGWSGKPGGRHGATAVFTPTIDEVVRDAPCDIAVVKQRGIGEVHRILVPVRGGPHAELALRLADALGRRLDAQVDVLHVIPPGLGETVRTQAERALLSFIRENARGRSSPLVREGINVRNVILREAETADIVIMGAAVPVTNVAPIGGEPAGGVPRGRSRAAVAAPAAAATVDGGVLFGALPEAIAGKATTTVIVVRTKETPTRATFERAARKAETLESVGRVVEQVRSVPALVDRWFAESNFHHREFADLRRLVAIKEKQGLTISLVLPTLNEAETIGPIVRTARRELMERVPLVDDLLVIDSASEDATREIAAEEGARVVQHGDVLPRYGSFRGKGEGLWKSLYETTGDLVVWCDTDVRDWEPRMAYGTLGPLLTEPRISYVKGYYQRPIVEGGVLKEGGGGRVTELVARPLINLFFPELSGMIQPLSGEYAGRRSLLEAIPFFTGYAVEIGHLVDALERVGLEGLGQVDLDRRVHRNQELEGLTRMSFVILQAVMKRLEERRRARLFAEIGSTMKLPRSTPTRLSLEVIELADQERPPMIRIPEYLERRRGGG